MTAEAPAGVSNPGALMRSYVRMLVGWDTAGPERWEVDVIRWRPSQELVVLVCYTVALYMTVVDNTIIYTALPSVARDFHSSLADAQWVTLSYVLTLALMIPLSGWI